LHCFLLPRLRCNPPQAFMRWLLESVLSAALMELINVKIVAMRMKLFIMAERLKCGMASLRRPERSEPAALSAVATTDLLAFFIRAPLMSVKTLGDSNAPPRIQIPSQ